MLKYIEKVWKHYYNGIKFCWIAQCSAYVRVTKVTSQGLLHEPVTFGLMSWIRQENKVITSKIPESGKFSRTSVFNLINVFSTKKYLICSVIRVWINVTGLPFWKCCERKLWVESRNIKQTSATVRCSQECQKLGLFKFTSFLLNICLHVLTRLLLFLHDKKLLKHVIDLPL